MAADLAKELEQNIPLSELIETLRKELAASEQAGKGADLRFRVAEVELELKVAITRARKGKVGLKFWVIDASGELASGFQNLNTFKLKLIPQRIDRAGRRRELIISDEDDEG